MTCLSSFGVGFRDNWTHNLRPQRNMGIPISVKDSRKELRVGTLGGFLRLRDSKGTLRPEIFGLTCHHVVSELTGDVLKPTDDGLEIIYPSQRDHENDLWTYSERINATQREIENIEATAEIWGSKYYQSLAVTTEGFR